MLRESQIRETFPQTIAYLENQGATLLYYPKDEVFKITYADYRQKTVKISAMEEQESTLKNQTGGLKRIKKIFCNNSIDIL